MTVLLDACAIIAFLRDEPAAAEVESLLVNETTHMTAINVAEVIDKLVRSYAQDADTIEAELAMLGLTLDPVTMDMALAAGRVRSECYHPKDCAVSLADCVAAVAALGTGSRLATSDSDLASLAETLGVAVAPLPNSTGT